MKKPTTKTTNEVRVMELLKLLQSRRSIRKYTDEHISDETLEKILLAGLLAPSSRAIYPVELVAVRDKEMLRGLSECKAAGAAMLKNADAAIVVIGDTAKSDAWIEDCSITMPSLTDQKRREVLKYIKVSLDTPTAEPSPPNLVPFKSRVYDIKTDKFLDYSPDMVFLCRFPYDYKTIPALCRFWYV